MRLLCALVFLFLPATAHAEGHSRLYSLAEQIRVPGDSDITLVDFGVLRQAAARHALTGDTRAMFVEMFTMTPLRPTLDNSRLMMEPFIEEFIGRSFFEIETFASWGYSPEANGILTATDGFPDLANLMTAQGLTERNDASGPVYWRGESGMLTIERENRSIWSPLGQSLRFAPRGESLFVAYTDEAMELHLSQRATLADQPGFEELLAALAAQTDFGPVAQVYLLGQLRPRSSMYPSFLDFAEGEALIAEWQAAPEMPAASFTAFVEWRDGPTRTAALVMRLPSEAIAQSAAATWTELANSESPFYVLAYSDLFVGAPSVRIIPDDGGAVLILGYTALPELDAVRDNPRRIDFQTWFNFYAQGDLMLLIGRN